ncbi:MAG: 50S ribosomal protein L3 [Actinobacteria bacterium ATB1]|nr:50S ribosomal protein L3 [Actinobacteria bacterium ATB1]
MKGILGEKIGMTQIFDDDGRVVPVTVLKVAGCRIGQVKTEETDGYRAVQLCLGTLRQSKVNKPMAGHAKKHGIETPRKIVELRVADDDVFESGQTVAADIFESGEKVDVVGVSKGKGFAGVMKRHNFRGLKASHGTHRVHRHPGAIGMCATPARVIKGMKMAGRLGHGRVTVQNVTVVSADPERELILLRGGVPGPRGSILMVREPSKPASGSKAEKGSD